MPDPFITEQDVVDLIGRGTATDPGMIIAVDAACDIVRDLTEQQINRGTTTVALDGTGTDALLLPQLPVNSAGTVTVNGIVITDYTLADNGVLFRGTVGQSDPYWPAEVPPERVWPKGRQNVSVTYDHGYANADIPRSVRGLALSIARRMVIQGPALQEQSGDQMSRYAVADTDLTSTEKLIVRKHRHHR